MSDLDALFAALRRSKFRGSFRLGNRELSYLRQRGRRVVLHQAAEFITERLAPAQPRNDGKQTPWRGHPVFIAQHATATCCRTCLEKWHHIPKGVELNAGQREYIVGVIARWLNEQDEQL